MPSRNLENHWSVKLHLCAFTLLPYRGAMLLLEQYRCMTPEKCQDLKCARWYMKYVSLKSNTNRVVLHRASAFF